MYPKLVRTAKTPAEITLYAAEMNEFNEREAAVCGIFLCNFQAGGGIAFTEQKQQIRLSGTLLIDGDICPECFAPVDGTVTVNGAEFRAVRVQKCRNPDGSVNYTKIEVV